jgi:hypothetical protein
MIIRTLTVTIHAHRLVLLKPFPTVGATFNQLRGQRTYLGLFVWTRKVLSELGLHAASLCGKGVEVHLSGHPGAGKSFNIRMEAANKG